MAFELIIAVALAQRKWSRICARNQCEAPCVLVCDMGYRFQFHTPHYPPIWWRRAWYLILFLTGAIRVPLRLSTDIFSSIYIVCWIGRCRWFFEIKRKNISNLLMRKIPTKNNRPKSAHSNVDRWKWKLNAKAAELRKWKKKTHTQICILEILLWIIVNVRQSNRFEEKNRKKK